MKAAFFGGVTVLALLAGPALAADIPVKAPPMAAAVNWTGYYFGGSVGVARGDIRDWCFAGGSCVTNADDTNWAGGGHVGIQWQTGQFVLGAEAKWIGTDLNPFNTCPNATYDCRLHIDSYWTAGARLGYVMGNGLFYATGGYAQSKIDRDALTRATGVVAETWSSTHSGWFFGNGAAWRIAGTGWVVGVEYNHIVFESKTATGSAPFSEVVTVKSNIDTLQARVSYLFNWWGR